MEHDHYTSVPEELLR